MERSLEGGYECIHTSSRKPHILCYSMQLPEQETKICEEQAYLVARLKAMGFEERESALAVTQLMHLPRNEIIPAAIKSITRKDDMTKNQPRVVICKCE